MGIDPILEKEIVDGLMALHGQENFRPGLERLRSLASPWLAPLKQLQVQGRLKIVIIAGTNGKGQTTYDLAHTLTSQGLGVAQWISPHVLSIRERMGLGRETISYPELQDCLACVQARVPPSQCSFYEVLFLAFLEWAGRLAREGRLDVLALEVGLGGRFDAVNIFDADMAAVTSIARDHESILGRGYRRILKEKLGVARPGRLVLSCLQLQFCRQIARNELEAIGAPHWDLFEQGVVDLDDSYFLRNRTLAMVLVQAILNGPRSIGQASCAHARQMALRAELPELKGRLEEMTRGSTRFIFIGAHNLDGIRNMVRHMQTRGETPLSQVLCSFSQRPEGEIRACLRLLEELGPLKIGEFHHPKAALLKDIALEHGATEIRIGAYQSGAIFSSDWMAFLGPPLPTGEVLVTGSYYFIGEVQKHLLGPGADTPLDCSDAST